MSTIILDCGFGGICKNDSNIIKQMIFAIKEIDTGKHEIIFKWQLFTKETIPNLEPLSHDSFALAYHTAKKLGYKTTSSVFDEESLQFLELFDVPWIKIAARSELHKLLIPKIKKHKSIVSIGEKDFTNWPKDDSIEVYLHCIPKYPAIIEQYESLWDLSELQWSISDHTIGLELFKKYKPQWWEKHYLLDREQVQDPFGTEWYVTPKDLEEIL